VGLPNKYVDVSVAPKASCIDGVLRVAVLKKATRALEVPIRNGADEEDAMDTEDADGMISLSVPGFGVQDISVVLHKPEDSLTVTGDSKTFGKFSKTFKNLPNGVELEHLSASVAHGILTIRMDDPNAIEERDIVVTNLALNIDQETQMVLIRRSVPGVSSADVSCKLNADRTVRVDVSTSNTRATLSTSVPREADLSSIQASCVDGILTVTATRDASANQSRETRIVVSGDSPAALALEEPSSLPEADVKDAADAEDFDGKVEDVRDA
jgi:HSP20 family molecular chaperone IbpA